MNSDSDQSPSNLMIFSNFLFFFYFFVATEQLTILVDKALINHVGTYIAYCGEV